MAIINREPDKHAFYVRIYGEPKQESYDDINYMMERLKPPEVVEITRIDPPPKFPWLHVIHAATMWLFVLYLLLSDGG